MSDFVSADGWSAARADLGAAAPDAASPRLGRRQLLTAAAALATGASLAPWTGGTAVAGASGFSSAPDALGPASQVRPIIRWWLPGAAITDEAIVADVASMARAGFQAAELVAFPATGIDTHTAGWGGQRWREVLIRALRAGRAHGIAIDITLGPKYPIAVPGLSLDSAAVARELVSGSIRIDGTYTGAVPAHTAPATGHDPFGGSWPAGEAAFVAVTAGRVTGVAGSTTLLDPASLSDLTPLVRNGQLSWTPPAAGTWLLTGFWQRPTGQWISGLTDGPAYVVDHFGASGATALTDYWDEHILNRELRDLLAATPASMFSDSLQLQATLPWSPAFLAEFSTRHGYELTPYLPILPIPGLHQYNPFVPVNTDSAPEYDLADGTGHRIREDYYRALTALHTAHHLNPLREWSGTRLGRTLRYEMSYGATLDMGAGIAAVDLPEIESLGFGNSTDRYLAAAGAARVHGKSLSVEAFPVIGPGQAHSQTWSDVLRAMHGAIVGGVQQLALHGYPHADAPGASWPGWHPFGQLITEAWGPRSPQWRHAPDITAYLGRLQAVASRGAGQVDVAVYRHRWWDNQPGPQLGMIDPSELLAAGYTYDYIGPSAILASDPIGRHHAILLHHQDTMPLEVAERLHAAARRGQLIIVVGDPPVRVPGRGGSVDAQLRSAVGALLGQRTVHPVSDLASALSVLRRHVRPTAVVTPAGAVRAAVRVDGSATWVMIHNPTSDAVEGTVTLPGRDSVYLLNPWTGRLSSAAAVHRGPAGLSMPLRLAAGQIMVLTMRPPIAAAPPDAYLLAVNGRPMPAMGGELTGWRVQVESWEPGDGVEARLRSVDVRMERPITWDQHPELQDVSGIGRYTTTFQLSAADARQRIALDLGSVFGTARTGANGVPIRPADPLSPVVELDGLRAGRNTLEVEVTTTLHNRLRVTDADHASRPRQPYGLAGPVILRRLPA